MWHTARGTQHAARGSIGALTMEAISAASLPRESPPPAAEVTRSSLVSLAPQFVVSPPHGVPPAAGPLAPAAYQLPGGSPAPLIGNGCILPNLAKALLAKSWGLNIRGSEAGIEIQALWGGTPEPWQEGGSVPPPAPPLAQGASARRGLEIAPEPPASPRASLCTELSAPAPWARTIARSPAEPAALPRAGSQHWAGLPRCIVPSLTPEDPRGSSLALPPLAPSLHPIFCLGGLGQSCIAAP